MTETVKKTRRSPAEIKAWHLAQAASVEARVEVRLKGVLERLSKACQEAALQTSDKPRAALIGQAATNLTAAAASIKLPQ
jgi:hypothetical protein